MYLQIVTAVSISYGSNEQEVGYKFKWLVLTHAPYKSTFLKNNET